MFRSKSKRAHEREREYASCKDFQRIFTEDMVGLHRLAFLLTADEAKAEQCFVAGLDDSIHGNPVFRQWARAWSKRAIIQNAIKMIAPVPASSSRTAEIYSRNGSSPEDGVAIVSAWNPFERFVFVMAVLEGYSVRECSAFLACPVQDVVDAKALALKRLAGHPWPEPFDTKRKDLAWNLGLARGQVA
jgi:hypothetical protein